MSFALGKHEKLKSRKLIEKLFSEGKSVKKFPLRLIFLEIDHDSEAQLQVSFSVPKRNFKKAVDRNRIKRLLRESYRLKKKDLGMDFDKSCIFMITFIGKKEPTFDEIEQKTEKILKMFANELKNKTDEKN